eukprot:gene7942-9472_t
MVYAEDIRQAYLSDVAYATLPSNQFPQNKLWDRVNASLSSPAMTAKIGPGWTVYKNSNGQYKGNSYAVVVVNESERRVAVLCRGTAEFVNDLLINDIGGGFHLTRKEGRGVLELTESAKQFAEVKGYKLTCAGHSLGGSLASAVGRLLNVETYTFNAPDLRHGISEVSDKASQAFNSTKLHAYRLANDLVSLIGVDGNIAEALPNNEHVNSFEAHLLKNVISAMETTFKAAHGFIPNGCTREVVLQGVESAKGFEGGAVWATTRTDVAFIFNSDNTVQQVQYVIYHTEGNLFFTRTVQSMVVLDSTGKEISRFAEQTFNLSQLHLSQHSEAALNAAQVTAVTSALNSLLSQGVKIDVRELAANAGISAGKAFADSVAGTYINHALKEGVSNGGLALAENVLSSAIQKGGVEVAYQLLHGNREAAIRSSIESLANAALSSGLGLPLSYSTSYQVSTGSLFGSRVLYSNEKSYELGVGSSTVLDRFIGQASLGLAFNRVSDVYTLRNGQVVQREAGGLSGYVKLGPVSGSVGVYNGVETYQPVSTTKSGADGVDVSRTTWGSRSFEGQLMLRVHAGNRLFTANILPAFSSTKKTFWEEHRADGNPFEVRHSGVNTMLPMQPNTGSGEANLPTFQEYKAAQIAINQTGGTGKVSSAPEGPVGAGDSMSLGNNSVGSVSTDGVRVQTNSVLTQFGHAGQINQLMANQGHTESVTQRYGTHEQYKHGLTKRDVYKTYDHTVIHEASATAEATVMDGVISIHVHRTDLDQSAEDLTHLNDRTKTAGVNHRGNKVWDYAPGQSRTMNNDRVVTGTDLTVQRKEDGSDFSSTTNTSTNTAGETVTDVRHVQELGNDTYTASNGHSGGFTDEQGLIDSTTAHTKVNAKDATGTHNIETQEFDTTVCAFGDVRSETTDGKTTYFKPGEKSEYKYELGTQHVKSEVTTKADHTAYSKDHALGKREFNGLAADDATMDIYAKQTVTTETVDHIFDKDGKKVEGGDKLGESVVEKVHGNFTLQNKGTAVDGKGAFDGKKVITSAVKNEFVQGSASCTVGSTTTGANPSSAKYEINDLKDLDLKATVIGKQYINSYTAAEGEAFSCTTGPTTIAADGSKTTISDRFTRIDDVTTQTANVGADGDPSLTVNDLTDLSVEDGGVAISTTEDKKARKNVRGNVDRKRIMSGSHNTHVVHESTSRGNAMGATVSQDFDDFVNPINIESKIESGVGDNAVLSDTKTTIDANAVVHQHTHVEKTVGLLNFTNKTTITTDTTDSTKPLEPAKHTSKTTHAVSAGSSRGAGALAGGVTNLVLGAIHDGRSIDRHAVGNVAISGAEAFLVGNAASLLEVSGQVASGFGIIAGVAAGAAVARIGLDIWKGGQIEKHISAERVKAVDANDKELVVGSRVEVSNAGGSDKPMKGKVLKVEKEEKEAKEELQQTKGIQCVKAAGAIIEVKLFYDVQYDLDAETMAVNGTASVGTSVLQAWAASGSMGIVSVVGGTIGGGVIMAIPMVVDIAKVSIQMLRGKVDKITGGISIAANVGGIIAGGLTSWGISAGLAAALGTAAAVSTATGIGIVVAGAIGFSVAAFYAGKFVSYWLWYWYRSYRIKKLRSTYAIEKTGQQWTSVAKVLKSDLNQGKEKFDATLKELEELYHLEEKQGSCKLQEKQDGVMVFTWLGYMVTVLAHIKQLTEKQLVQAIDSLLTEKAYKEHVAETKKALKEKETNTKRIAELRKKYDIDKKLESEQQMEKIVRQLKFACHPDRGGDTAVFQQTVNDLEELFDLEEKMGTFQYYQKEENLHVMTWAGYTMAILSQLKTTTGKAAEQFFDMFTTVQYRENLEKAKKDMREKEKQKVD